MFFSCTAVKICTCNFKMHDSYGRYYNNNQIDFTIQCKL